MGLPDYIDDHVARTNALHEAEKASATAYLAHQETLHPYLRDCTDPSASGPRGVVGYRWMLNRGD